MVQSGLLCALVWLIVQGVDRLLSWQTFQRPIVTATLTGLLLGDIRTGMVMAASLEAIFMGISAIGGSIPGRCLRQQYYRRGLHHSHRRRR